MKPDSLRERLEIEITESALVRNLEAAQEILGGLREARAFTTCDLKLDKITIDGSFIHSMISEKEDAGIVRALVGLAHALGITVAAEGIQDSAQQAALIRTGGEQGQGYLYSDAISAEHVLDVIEADVPGLQLIGR